MYMKHVVTKCFAVTIVTVSAVVSVAVNCRDGEENFVVTCVHSTSEQEKTVQVWRCPSSEPPRSVGHKSLSYRLVYTM